MFSMHGPSQIGPDIEAQVGDPLHQDSDLGKEGIGQGRGLEGFGHRGREGTFTPVVVDTIRFILLLGII
jgi:hypothetical protein